LRGWQGWQTTGTWLTRFANRSAARRWQICKQSAWIEFEHGGYLLFDAAAREWDGLAQHPARGRDGRFKPSWHARSIWCDPACVDLAIGSEPDRV
jgi:hypothetical protein